MTVEEYIKMLNTDEMYARMEKPKFMSGCYYCGCPMDGVIKLEDGTEEPCPYCGRKNE